MKHFDGKVAAITGAASGMGRALAEEMARRGCHVALSDIDEAGLTETALRAKRRGVEVTTATVDVADRAAVEAWADRVVTDHGRVNLIFNNAGVALAATVADTTAEDLAWLMDIDYWGVVHGTQAFLPHLKATGDGHVVNTSSIFGLLGIPTLSAYCSAKFAVRGFTEALRIELDLERCGVSATSVHPGGVKTEIVRRARTAGVDALGRDPEQARRDVERLFITSPESAARQIVRAVQLDRRRALIGPDAVVVELLAKLPAGLTQRLVGRAAARGL